LVLDASNHNEKESESKKQSKYNSRYTISHNNLKLMEFIDPNKLGTINRSSIKWK
jgi:hypothetical protein